MVIPLTEIEVAAVVAQTRASEIRTRDSRLVGKTFPRNITTQIAIVIRPLAESEPYNLTYRNGGPRNARCFHVIQDLPRLGIHSVNTSQIARAEPTFAIVPCQGWRRRPRRNPAFHFIDHG